MRQAYVAALILGGLAGLVWLGLAPTDPGHSRPARRAWPGRAALLDAGLAALVGALLGARLTFVAFHWPYYRDHLGEILAMWQGGLSWSGAVVGGISGLALYAAIGRLPFWVLADALAIPTALVGFAGWTGCLLSGCAYGYQIPDGWRLAANLDMFGLRAVRWPTQIVGATFCLGVILLLALLRGREFRPGGRALLALGLMATNMVALSFVRADPMGTLFSLRLDFLGSAAILMVTLAVLIAGNLPMHKEPR